jgi:hypothetical protein
VNVYQNLYRTILEKAEQEHRQVTSINSLSRRRMRYSMKYEPGKVFRCRISRNSKYLPAVSIPAVAAQPTTPESVCAAPFTQNLKRGDSGAETTRLQQFLNTQGYNLEVAGTFGPQTEAAVKDFQLQHADEILTPAELTVPNGFWGALSRKVADRLCAQ